MLEMKKNPGAKLGAIVASMVAFGAVLGIVHANQPGSASTAQPASVVAAVQSSSTATSGQQSQAAAPTPTAATQQQSQTSSSTTTHTTTHVS